MTTESPNDAAATQAKLERIRQLQEAIEQASHPVPTAAPIGPHEQQVMLRILAQRRRWRQRAAADQWADSTRKAKAGREGQSPLRPMRGEQDAAASAVPLVADAQAFVLRHPVAIGLTLGAGLVIGPRKLFKTVLWAAPLFWRGWRMAERVNATLRSRK